MKEMTVGKLAKTAGVNIETIRYYEQRGLLPDNSSFGRRSWASPYEKFKNC
jgi:DNA-binding transcriptional MerR regulator